MRTVFSDSAERDLDHTQKERIRRVLRRMRRFSARGKVEPTWDHKQPAVEVLVKRVLMDGNTECIVLEIEFSQGDEPRLKIAKIGPQDQIKNEIEGWEVIKSPNVFFAPIQGATSAVIDPGKRAGRYEGVIYDHVCEFTGRRKEKLETLSDRVRRAIQDGGEHLDIAVKTIEKTLDGITSKLYSYHKDTSEKIALFSSEKDRLGPDAVVEINGFDLANGLLRWDDESPVEAHEVMPEELVSISLGDEAEGAPSVGSIIELKPVTLDFWSNRLFARGPGQAYVQLDCDQTKMEELKAQSREEQEFVLRGRLKQLRIPSFRERFLQAVPGIIKGDGWFQLDGISVPDPFRFLERFLLRRVRSRRVFSKAHGDLHGGNILCVGDDACVIDYGCTTNDAPIFADFARLEGSLVRSLLADKLTWAQHVRMQRFLVVATLAGAVEVQQNLRHQLATESLSAANAFDICCAIRQHAHRVYPRDYQSPEFRSRFLGAYLEQLFLFAHQSFKWPDMDNHKWACMTAMAGVVATALDDAHLVWTDADCKADGAIIASQLEYNPVGSVGLQSRLVRGSDKLNEQGYECEDMEQALDDAREALARAEFRGAADDRINLKDEHDTFMQRTARLNGDPVSESRDVFEIMADNPRVILEGVFHEGRSAISREWRYRLACQLQNGQVQSLPQRIPCVISAADLDDRLARMEPDARQEFPRVIDDQLDHYVMSTGAVHLTINACEPIGNEASQRIVRFLESIQGHFPRTPICVLQTQAQDRLKLDYPIATLDPIQEDVGKSYIQRYFGKHASKCGLTQLQADSLANRLIATMFPEGPVEKEDSALWQLLRGHPFYLHLSSRHTMKYGDPPNRAGDMLEPYAMSKLFWTDSHDHQKDLDCYHARKDLLGELAMRCIHRDGHRLPNGELQSLLNGDDDKKRVYAEIVSRSSLLQIEPDYVQFRRPILAHYFAGCRNSSLSDQDIRDSFTEAAAGSRSKIPELLRMFMMQVELARTPTEVIKLIVEQMIEYDPRLAARCLAKLSNDAPSANELCQHFIKSQTETVYDSDAGASATQMAIDALVDYGRQPAWQALYDVARAISGEVTTRCQAIEALTSILARYRSQRIEATILGELSSLLKEAFEDEECPPEVICTAIRQVGQAGCRDLTAYVCKYLESNDKNLAQAARETCEQLEVSLPSEQFWIRPSSSRRRSKSKRTE